MSGSGDKLRSLLRSGLEREHKDLFWKLASSLNTEENEPVKHNGLFGKYISCLTAECESYEPSKQSQTKDINGKSHDMGHIYGSFYGKTSSSSPTGQIMR